MTSLRYFISIHLNVINNNRFLLLRFLNRPGRIQGHIECAAWMLIEIMTVFWDFRLCEVNALHGHAGNSPLRFLPLR